MGIELIIGIAALVVAITTSALLAVYATHGAKADDALPKGIDDFKPMGSNEGVGIPRVWGRVRVEAPNFLWYGNLRAVPRIQIVSGSDNNFVAGYDYYMDMWLGLCQGPGVSIVTVYIDDLEPRAASGTGLSGLIFQDWRNPSTYTTHFFLNPGSGGGYVPSEPGTYAAPLTPLAHVFLKQLYVGLERTFTPTMHFVVDRPDSTGLPNGNLTKGINPAAIVYDMLTEAGEPASEINWDSFVDAAAYWATKGYGLNIQRPARAELAEDIAAVFSYVDACLRKDSDGKWELKANKDTDTYVASMTTEDFDEFDFARDMYHSLPSSFVATFKDENQAYSDRTAKVRNPALSRLTGNSEAVQIDLRAFRDVDTVSKRLCEIVKQRSYPRGKISCVVGEEFWDVRPGDVVRITNAEQGISNELYRVLERTVPALRDNKLSFRMEQFIEASFDDNYFIGGGSLSTGIDVIDDPTLALGLDVFELPMNPVYGTTPAYLVAATRPSAAYGLFVAEYSTVSADGPWTLYDDCTIWSNLGTLNVTYPSSTNPIDDDVGISVTLIAPYGYAPVLESWATSLSNRGDLFKAERLIIIDDEVMAWQTITQSATVPDGYILTGIIRGLWGTTPATHASGATIRIAQLGRNVVSGIEAAQLWIRISGRSAFNTPLGMAKTSAAITYAAKARTPPAPARINVSRSGTTCTVRIVPNTLDVAGAGMYAETASSDEWPHFFHGDFQHYVTSGDPDNPTAHTDINFSYTQAGSHTLFVRARQFGYVGPYLSCSVGAADGSYASAGYEVPYNTQGWLEMIDVHMAWLNDPSLYLQNLSDVQVSGLANDDVLQWNGSKWVNVSAVSVFGA